MNRRTSSIAACIMIAAVGLGLDSAATAGSTIYVNGTCGDDGWTGQSEVCAAPNGPKQTIQAGINAATNGDEVVLADGIYTGDGNKNLDLLGMAVTLRSTSDAHSCVIDCEGVGRALKIVNAGSVAQIIQGIDFHHGGGATSPDPFAGHGGAVFVQNSNPTFIACEFLENEDDVGSAAEVRGFPGASFRQCMFISNQSGAAGAVSVFQGANINFVECTFAHNDANLAAGAIEACVNSSTTVQGCQFIDNSAGFMAGAVHACDHSSIWNCMFAVNSASLGGALHTNGVAMEIGNSTFVHNASHAAYISGEDPHSIINCILWATRRPRSKRSGRWL